MAVTGQGSENGFRLQVKARLQAQGSENGFATPVITDPAPPSLPPTLSPHTNTPSVKTAASCGYPVRPARPHPPRHPRL